MADQTVSLRVIVENPPPKVRWAVQSGKSELLDPIVSTEKRLVFEFSVRARDDQGDMPNFLGPFAHGPVGGRFVYVNSGTSAGQHDSPWTRRAKIPLGTITWSLIRKGSVLEARIAGTGRDGGPACATVPLLGGGWNVAQ
jgi:hypothetical protein